MILKLTVRIKKAEKYYEVVEKYERCEIMHDLFMKKGIDSFNRHSFMTHIREFWEDLWSDYRLSDAKFIQVLIQLAVGYFHITNNNKNGALGLLNKCKPKF